MSVEKAPKGFLKGFIAALIIRSELAKATSIYPRDLSILSHPSCAQSCHYLDTAYACSISMSSTEVNTKVRADPLEIALWRGMTPWRALKL